MKCPFCGHENISGNDTCENCDEDLTAFDGVRPHDTLERSLVKDTIGSVASCEAFIVSPDTPIRQVAEGLKDENRCGLIMDQGELVGVVTVRDLLQKAMGKNLDLNKVPISKIMTPNPEILRPEDKIVLALNKMAIGGYRHIPIQKAKNEYEVISVRDILAYLAKMFPDAVGVYQKK